MKTPTIVFLMCKCGANVVGSYAKYLVYGTGRPKDFDLIVPPEKWCTVSLLIPKNAGLNRHGGLKFKDKDGNIIDVWPCSVE